MIRNINLEGLLINVICAIYLLVVAPYVINITQTTIYGWQNTTSAFALGFFLIVFNSLEALSISPFIHQLLHANKKQKELFAKFFLMLLLHFVITLLLISFTFQLFGFDFKNQPAIIVFIFIFGAFKEIYIIKSCFSTQSPKVILNPLISKIIIALYACFVFTIFIDANNGDLHRDNIGAMIFDLIPMTIFIAFFYIATRLPYTLYNMTHPSNINDKLLRMFSFLMILIPIIIRRIG